MNRQEIINYLRELADWIEERGFGDKDVEYLREITDSLQTEPNPIQDIVKLNEERYGLDFDGFNAMNKLKEEMEELEQAYRRNDEIEFLDALADIIVIATGEIRKMGYDPELVLNEVVKEISSRKQDKFQYERWERGLKESGEKWEKDLTQDPNTLYKANFEKAKL